MSTSSSTSHQQRFRKRVSSSSSNSKKVIQQLPDAVQVLDEVLKNKDTLICLIRFFGGQTVYIPARWPPYGKNMEYKGHELRKILSPSQMVRIVAHYSGTALYIPKCTKYLLAIRNSSIIDAYYKATRLGTSSRDAVKKLARKHQLSDRRVWSILKTSEQES